MATTVPLPAGMPVRQARPASINTADVYGSTATGVPTTVMAGTAGGGRVQAATDDVDGAAPITINGIGPDFLARPAGVLLVLVGLLVALALTDHD